MFTGVMADDGQWLRYHPLVMEQLQEAQMSQ
jgi:ATP/maltotriose-dependent transcriptional regulator MalT